MDVTKVRPTQVERFVQQGQVSEATKANRLSAVLNFYVWCIRKGHATIDPTAPIEPPKRPHYLPRGLVPENVTAALLEAPDQRGELILLLMCQEALRAVEISRLQVGDVDCREHLIYVMGKGGRPRVMPVSDETWSALSRYMASRRMTAGPLLRSYTQPHQGISPSHVSWLASQWIQAAGIPESGHALRHSAAQHMLDAGATLEEVRDALGHASIKNTEIYTQRANLGKLRKVMGGRRYGPGRKDGPATK